MLWVHGWRRAKQVRRNKKLKITRYVSNAPVDLYNNLNLLYNICPRAVSGCLDPGL